MPSQCDPSPSWSPICLFSLCHYKMIHYCLSQLKGSVLFLLAITPQYNRTPCTEFQIFLHTKKVPLAGSPDFYLQEDKEPIEWLTVTTSKAVSHLIWEQHRVRGSNRSFRGEGWPAQSAKGKVRTHAWGNKSWERAGLGSSSRGWELDQGAWKPNRDAQASSPAQGSFLFSCRGP